VTAAVVLLALLATEAPAPRPAPGRLELTGSLSRERQGASAVALADGDVLVCGGRKHQETASSCERWSGETGRWREVGSMAEPKSVAVMHRLADGRVLFIGGLRDAGPGPSRPIDAVEIFDPRTDGFSPAPPLPIPFPAAGAVPLDAGRLLLWRRRYDDRDRTPPLLIYDPVRLRGRPLDGPQPDFNVQDALALGGERVALLGLFRTRSDVRPHVGAVVWNSVTGAFGPLQDLGVSNASSLSLLRDPPTGGFWVFVSSRPAVDLLDRDGRPVKSVPYAEAPPEPSLARPQGFPANGPELPLPDGRGMYLGGNQSVFLWIPDTIRLRAPCAALAAYVDRPAGHLWQNNISPECRQAVAEGTDRDLDPLLRQFATELVLPGPEDLKRRTTVGWTALCLLAPPWSARFLARTSRHRDFSSDGDCFVGLINMDTDESRGLVRDHLEDRGVVGEGEAVVSHEVFSALTLAPRLRASLGPVLDRARARRATGTAELYKAICPATPRDPPELQNACGAATGQDLTPVAVDRSRRERLTGLGVRLAIGSGALAAGVLGCNDVSGQVVATGSAAVAGAYWFATTGGSGDWGAGFNWLLTGTLGLIGGGVAGYLGSREPGAPRIVVTTISVAPLMIAAVASTVREWPKP
jgi:hypothetical protein